MSELYICVECEVASNVTTPTEIDTHGLCLRCGSSSVIPCSTLLELATKAKQREVVRETPTEQVKLRVQAMKDERRKNHEPVRSYLFTLQYDNVAPDYDTSAERVLNENLLKAIDQWDGWAYHVYFPWQFRFDEDINPYPGKWVIELINGVKGATNYYIILDEYNHEVKPFQSGTV